MLLEIPCRTVHWATWTSRTIFKLCLYTLLPPARRSFSLVFPVPSPPLAGQFIPFFNFWFDIRLVWFSGNRRFNFPNCIFSGPITFLFFYLFLSWYGIRFRPLCVNILLKSMDTEEFRFHFDGGWTKLLFFLEDVLLSYWNWVFALWTVWSTFLASLKKQRSWNLRALPKFSWLAVHLFCFCFFPFFSFHFFNFFGLNGIIKSQINVILFV